MMRGGDEVHVRGYRFFEHALIGTSTFSSYSVNAAFEFTNSARPPYRKPRKEGRKHDARMMRGGDEVHVRG
jgi:hypothetical protein